MKTAKNLSRYNLFIDMRLALCHFLGRISNTTISYLYKTQSQKFCNNHKIFLINLTRGIGQVK
jgi:hypothetical protein